MIAIDSEATRAYDDTYTTPCSCEACARFYERVDHQHPQLAVLLAGWGIDTSRAIEVMDNEDGTYDAYLSVQATMNVPHETHDIDGIELQFDRPDSPELTYGNTGMQPPYVILTVRDIPIR